MAAGPRTTKKQNLEPINDSHDPSKFISYYKDSSGDIYEQHNAITAESDSSPAFEVKDGANVMLSAKAVDIEGKKYNITIPMSSIPDDVKALLDEAGITNDGTNYTIPNVDKADIKIIDGTNYAKGISITITGGITIEARAGSLRFKHESTTVDVTPTGASKTFGTNISIDTIGDALRDSRFLVQKADPSATPEAPATLKDFSPEFLVAYARKRAALDPARRCAQFEIAPGITVFCALAVKGYTSDGSEVSNDLIVVKTKGKWYALHNGGFVLIKSPKNADAHPFRYSEVDDRQDDAFLALIPPSKSPKAIYAPIRIDKKPGATDEFDPNSRGLIIAREFYRFINGATASTGTTFTEGLVPDTSTKKYEIGSGPEKIKFVSDDRTSYTEIVSDTVRSAAVALAGVTPPPPPPSSYVSPTDNPNAGLALADHIKVNVHPVDSTGNPVMDGSGHPVTYGSKTTIAAADGNNLISVSKGSEKFVTIVNDGGKANAVFTVSMLSPTTKQQLTAAGCVIVAGKITLRDVKVEYTSTGMTLTTDNGTNKITCDINPRGVVVKSGPSAGDPNRTSYSQLAGSEVFDFTINEPALTHDATKMFYTDADDNRTEFNVASPNLAKMPAGLAYAIATSEIGAGHNPAVTQVKKRTNHLNFFAANNVQDFGGKSSNIILAHGSPSSSNPYIVIKDKLVEFRPSDVEIRFQGNGSDGLEDANLSYTIIVIKDTTGNVHQIPVYTPVEIDPATGKVTYKASDGLKFVRAFYDWIYSPTTIDQASLDSKISSVLDTVIDDPLEREKGTGKITKPDPSAFDVGRIHYAGRAELDESLVVVATPPEADTRVFERGETIGRYEGDFSNEFDIGVTARTFAGTQVTDADGKPKQYSQNTAIYKNEGTDEDKLLDVYTTNNRDPAVLVEKKGTSATIKIKVDQIPPAARRVLNSSGLMPVDDYYVIDNVSVTFTESGMKVIGNTTAGSPPVDKQIQIDVNPRGIMVAGGAKPADGAEFKPLESAVAIPGGAGARAGEAGSDNCWNMEIYQDAFENENCTFQYLDNKGKLRDFEKPHTDLSTGVLVPGTKITDIHPSVIYAWAAANAPAPGEAGTIANFGGSSYEIMTARLPGYKNAAGDNVSANIILIRDINDGNKRYLFDDGKLVEIEGNPEYCFDGDRTRMFAVIHGSNGKEYHLPVQQQLEDAGTLNTATPGYADLRQLGGMLEDRDPHSHPATFTPATITEDPLTHDLSIGSERVKNKAMDAAKVPKNVAPEPPTTDVKDYGAVPVKKKKEKRAEEEESGASGSGTGSGTKKYPLGASDDAIKAAQYTGWGGMAVGALIFLAGIFNPALFIAGLTIFVAGGITSVGAPIVGGFINSVEVGGPFGAIARAKRAVSRREKQAQKVLAYEKAIERAKAKADEIERDLSSGDVKAANKLRKQAAKLEKKQEKLLAKGGPKLLKKIADKKGDAERKQFAADNPEASEEELEAQELSGRKDFILQCAEKDPTTDRWQISKEGYAVARSILMNMTEAEAARYLESLSPEEREVVKQAISDVRDAACDLLRANDDRTLNPQQIKERLGENAYDYIRGCRGVNKDDSARRRARRGTDVLTNRMMDNIFGVNGGTDWVHGTIAAGTDNANVTQNVEQYVRDGGILDQLDTISYASAALDDMYEQLDETGVVTIRSQDGTLQTFTRDQLDAAKAQIGYEQALLRQAITAQGNARQSLLTQLRDSFNGDVVAALDPNNAAYNTAGSRMLRRMRVRPAGTAGERYEAEARAADYGFTIDEADNRISVSEQQYRRIRALHNENENNIEEYSDIGGGPTRETDTPVEHGH